MGKNTSEKIKLSDIKADGPHIEQKPWYLNGIKPSDIKADGPAVEHIEQKPWYLNGSKVDRDEADGPVVEYTREKENKVDSKMKSIKEECVEGFKRFGTEQLSQIAHKLLLGLAQQHMNLDGPRMQFLNEMLQSELGKALVKELIGQLLPMLPADKQALEMIAYEFRVQAKQNVMNEGLRIGADLVPELLPLAQKVGAAVAATASGNVFQALNAWKTVNDNIPTKLRVSPNEMMRVEPASSENVAENVADEVEPESEKEVLKAIPMNMSRCS
jgi:hypothetical protein